MQQGVLFMKFNPAVPYPKYENLHGWEKYHTQFLLEYMQSIDEGKDLSAYKDFFNAAHNLPDGRFKLNISDVIYQLVQEAPLIPNYKYIEPSDIEEIRKHSKGSKLPLLTISKDELFNKVKGAWYGRVCGCLLGKPFEGIMHDDFETVLKMTGNYPMARYVNQSELTEDILKKIEYTFTCKTFPDTIEIAPIDDDTNYTIMGTKIIENFGKDFTSENIAHTWIFSQLKDDYCTAERVAYLNLVNGYTPGDSAIYKNPYREWIGAQIRADYFGYINPNDIETAADMAWRDARISHIKNGIYGEIFVAAMLAAAYSCTNIKDIILYGLSAVPDSSRLHESILSVIDFYEKGNTYEDFLTDFHKRYNEKISYDWCHTISNAEIVAAAMLYGNGDYGTSICRAVQAGMDTDCNGATVGSIIGLVNGFNAIDDVWTKPVNGAIKCSMFGMSTVNIDDLVATTINHIEKYGKNIKIK